MINYDVTLKSSHSSQSQNMSDPKLITINEFAKMCRTTVRTIRFYDKLGLLEPVQIDSRTKYRYYSPFQTRDFFRIRLLQNFKVPLKNIKETISRPYLEEKIKGVKQELEEKRKEYRFLQTINDFFFGKINLKRVMKKETIGPFTLFGTYVEQGSYHQITADMAHIEKKAVELGIATTGKRMVFYLDPDRYKPKNTRLEIASICQKVPQAIKLPQGYFVRKFNKTAGYVFTYKGPSEFITLVYEKLHEQEVLKKFPVLPHPFDYEIYGPLDAPSSYDYLTKIVFPLQTKLQKKTPNT